jgi:adenylosuccinate synthase
MKGRIVVYSPVLSDLLPLITPAYDTFPGWNTNNLMQTGGNLPSALEKFVKFIENETKVQVSLISIGPDRDQLIQL